MIAIGKIFPFQDLGGIAVPTEGGSCDLPFREFNGRDLKACLFFFLGSFIYLFLR